MKQLFLIFLILFSGMFFTGCTTTNNEQYNKNKTFQSFNNENYIWENFLFPTNRTTIH